MGVTQDNDQNKLIEKLQYLKDEGKEIPVVNMDMDKRIRGAVRKVLPKEETAIVADKFHIIKHVNSVIDLCRIAVEKTNREKYQIKRLLLMKTETLHKIKEDIKKEQQAGEKGGKRTKKWKKKIEKFEQLLQTNPEIKILWDLKNMIHGFYNCTSLETAKNSLQNIETFLIKNEKNHPEFRDLQNTFINWKTEILNYFIYRTTNAYIEGLNNKIETFKRKKCGFRNLKNFLKALCFMIFPLSDFFHSIISDF